MARLHKPPPFVGTVNGICIYKMRIHYYMRLASSLTGERVKTDPKFEQTMVHANLLGRAARIGSSIYRNLQPGVKKKNSYQKITGRVMKMIKNGANESDITSQLRKGLEDAM